MKKISDEELLSLLGGTSGETVGKCQFLLQMAGEHQAYTDEEAEDAWWDAWTEAYERCANS